MKLIVTVGGQGSTVTVPMVPAGIDGNIQVLGEVGPNDLLLIVRAGVLYAIPASAVGTGGSAGGGGPVSAGFTLDYSQPGNGLFLLSIL